MPEIGLTCPSCGKFGKVPDVFQGKSINCKKCGAYFRVGRLLDQPGADQQADRPASPADPDSAQSSSPAREPISFFCSHCGARLLGERSHVGQPAQCIACHQVTTVPAAVAAPVGDSSADVSLTPQAKSLPGWHIIGSVAAVLCCLAFVSLVAYRFKRPASPHPRAPLALESPVDAPNATPLAAAPHVLPARVVPDLGQPDCVEAQPKDKRAPVLAQVAPPAEPQLAADEARIVLSHNEFRAALGLGTLKPNAQLCGAARDHAAFMAQHDKLAHRDIGDGGPDTRAIASGYGYAVIAENIASAKGGEPDVDAIIGGWKRSVGHRMNMMNSAVVDIGCGISRTKAGTYYCVLFGRPRDMGLDPVDEADARQAAALAPAAAPAPMAAKAPEAKPAEPDWESLTVPELTDLLRKDPNNVKAYLARGVAFASKGDVDAGIADLTSAAELQANNPDVLYNRGIMFLKKKNYEFAVDDFTKLLDVDRSNYLAFVLRGTAYAECGETEKAISDCTEAIRIKPKKPDAYLERGRIYEKAGDPDMAFVSYNEAMKRYPDNTAAYANMAAFYTRFGKPEKAIACCNAALAIDKNYAPAYYERSRAYAKIGKADEARSDRARALRLNPSIGGLGRRALSGGSKP